MAKFLDDTGLARFWANLKPKLNAKQDKLTGQPGQVVGFDETGQAVAQDASSGGGGGEGSGVPSGCIVIWSGASTAIPNGWALCDGTNGTPDLRDRFVLGAGSSYAVGATGGESTHTLTTSEMPSHSHSAAVRATGSTATASIQKMNTTINTGSKYDTLSVTVYSAGGGAAHNNMPPYYALCFIMKL